MTINLYDNWQKLCKSVIENKKTLLNFKQSTNMEYMLEHDSAVHFHKEWIILINNFTAKLNVDDSFLQKLLLQNNEGATLNVTFLGIKTNANTLKYVYMALLCLDYFLSNNKQNVNIIEIGGGYGGFSINLASLLNYKNIEYDYTMIDIEYVIDVQKLYVKRHSDSFQKFSFVNFTEIDSMPTKNNSFLFSSYSLSEIPDEYRQIYYKSLFHNIKSGICFWNNPVIDIDDQEFSIIKEDEYPKTGPVNKIVFFLKKNKPQVQFSFS